MRLKLRSERSKDSIERHIFENISGMVTAKGEPKRGGGCGCGQTNKAH